MCRYNSGVIWVRFSADDPRAPSRETLNGNGLNLQGIGAWKRVKKIKSSRRHPRSEPLWRKPFTRRKKLPHPPPRSHQQYPHSPLPRRTAVRFGRRDLFPLAHDGSNRRFSVLCAVSEEFVSSGRSLRARRHIIRVRFGWETVLAFFLLFISRHHAVPCKMFVGAISQGLRVLSASSFKTNTPELFSCSDVLIGTVFRIENKHR